MKFLQNVAELENVYSVAPTLASTAKVLNHLSAEYRRYVEASPFIAVATVGDGGLDCSPRGDDRTVVTVLDDRTLALPDRRGNNRIDSLRNVLADPRIALLFLIPGSNTTFRVNGKAQITADQDFCNRFAVDGKPPRSVVVITIDQAYFQCGRAVVRSHLWSDAARVPEATLPTPGQVLDKATEGEIDGAHYDAEWPGRAAQSLW